MHRDELAAAIIWQIRLPRLIVAVLVGGSLAASGLVMQAYFRNSLASPGLLGVSSGGTAGAVVAIGLGISVQSLFVMPLFAVFGALVATGAVLILARRGASTERLLLAGIALNALLAAVTSFVLSNSVLSYERNARILFWLLGGLEDRTWEHVWMILPTVLAAAFLWPLGRQMDLLSLGAREAQSLGVDVKRLRRHHARPHHCSDRPGHRGVRDRRLRRPGRAPCPAVDIWPGTQAPRSDGPHRGRLLRSGLRSDQPLCRAASASVSSPP